MKPVSTGTGLIVLSATIAACFAISQLESRGKAIAAPGNPTIRQPNAPSQMPHGMPPRSAGMPGVPPTGSPPVWGGNVAPSDACQELEPDIRFTGPIHPITTCFDGNGYSRGFGSTDSADLDINGDGVLEHFSWGYVVLTQDTPPETAVMFRDEIVFDGTTTSVRYQPVLLAAPLLAFIQSQTTSNPISNLLYSFPGWRDMDNDGDLDLLFVFTVFTSDGGQSYVLGWLENTGYPASPRPNPFDLDHDGYINTADLSLLLMEFTN
jgi:hypothetical protein